MRGGKLHYIILSAGDLLVLYASLSAAIILRYGTGEFSNSWQLHKTPFTIIFAIWILIFYIQGLYDEINISGSLKIFVKLLSSLTLGGLTAITLFYFVPLFLITPRTNLLSTLIFSIIFLQAWRIIYAQIKLKSSKLRVLIIGSSPDIEELVDHVNRHPQKGYIISARKDSIESGILSTIKDDNISIVVASEIHQTNKQFVNTLYEILPLGITFMDFSTFYEKILGKVPVSLISEMWFLENLAEIDKKFFEVGKRTFDVFASIILGIITILIFPIVALIIKIESKGSVFYSHKRIGKGKEEFDLYKFRTMYSDAEKDGPKWAKVNDPRITFFGKFLRKARIDELPQIWNVLKGDLSFIGPRPERPEFVRELRKTIPYYDMRLLIRPGLSGWAQINPPYYYGNEKEAYIKLQYDLHYIKNRSLGLDMAIFLKTIDVLLSRLGR